MKIESHQTRILSQIDSLEDGIVIISIEEVRKRDERTYSV